METINFSLVGSQDIRFGRSTFEVTLADGSVVAVNEHNLDDFDGLLSVDDVVNTAVSTLLTLRHTTTGTPVPGIGTRLTFQAESADESPCDIMGLESILTDINAGSEDSAFYVLLRRAGSALSRALGFTVAGNFLLTLATTITANRILTLPDATDTLVGRQTTDTLTNKILNGVTTFVGSSVVHAQPVLHYTSATGPVGTPANTAETTLASVALAANALAANAKGVRIFAWGTVAANSNTKTMRLYFGSSVVAINNVTTAPNNTAWSLHATVLRSGPTAQLAGGHGFCGAVSQTFIHTTPTETLSSDVTIAVTGQNGVTSANDIVFQGATIEVLN